MAFTKVIKNAISTGCAMGVTVAVKKPRLRIVLRPDVLSEFGVKIKDSLQVLRGIDADKGKILLRKGGGFSISKNGENGKYGGRIDVPPFDGIPQEPCPLVSAHHEFNDGDLIITIPNLIPKKKLQNL